MSTFGALLRWKWHNFPAAAEMWPLFFPFEALLSMLPDGYWAAVSTSNALNLGRGSSSILTDSRWVLQLSARAVFDSTSWLFCSTRVLWRYWKCLFGCVWPQQRWHAARSLAYLTNPTAFKHRKLLCLCHQETRKWHGIQIFGQILAFVSCLASISCFCKLDLERSLDPRVQNANLQFFYWS